LCAAYALADEMADRVSIEHAITALNESGVLPSIDHSNVTISHEPWGEAAINLMSPRILIAAIRFITPDVALADATRTHKVDDGTTQTIPLLFVMKREGENWKIASVYVLASRVKLSKE
jgi:hypothetical protein